MVALPKATAALLPALLLVLPLAFGCGGGSEGSGGAELMRPTDGVLTVRAFEWGFEPSAIELKQGEPVRIEFENGGRSIHNLKIDGLEAAGVHSQSTGAIKGEEGQLFVGAAKGDAGTLEFTPQATGTFTYYCGIPRHRSLGMEGTLTVVP